MSEPAALARYLDSMRPRRLRYAAGIAVVVAVLAAFVGVEWSRGETAHVTLHTVRAAPQALALATPSATQQVAWRTSDRLAIGTPQQGGTVITWSAHTVRGRNARTGAQTWAYTRTDRSVCTAAQLAGTTIAVYAVGGNCDEVTALDSGTGHRVWTRTLDKDGMPLNGRPTYDWLVDGIADTFLVTSHGSADDVIYAIDPGGGLDRWTYTRHGCRITGAAIGSSGVLIGQDCTHPRCSGVKFCAAGPQLLLRDARTGNDNGKPNGDQIRWLDKGNADVPVSAGQVISAVRPSGRTLDRFTADTGRSLGAAALTGSGVAAGAGVAAGTGVAAGATAIDTLTADVLWIGGRVYAFTAGRSTPLWSTTTTGAPTVVAMHAGTGPPQLPTARITAPTATGVVSIDGGTGAVTRHFALPVTPGADAFPLGAGFLVGTATGTVAYR